MLNRKLFLGISSAFLICTRAFGAPTLNDFDAAGTPYTIGQVGGYAPVEVAGGPSGDFLRLTDGATGESNRAAFDRTAIGLYKSVTASFDFRFTPVIGQADGMGVAFLRTTDHGATGNGPAFSEEANLNGGSGAMLGIGLDIYNNGPSDDSNNNHMSLHANGLQGATVDPGFDYSNGQFHRADITWDYVKGGSQVTLVVTPDIFGTPGAPVTVFNKAFIAGLYPYESRISFNARTGGETANQDLDNVNVNYSLPAQYGWNYKPDFSGAAGDLTFVGTATIASNVLQLTTNGLGQTGSAWHTNKVDVSRGFVTEFEFDFPSPVGGEPGADGIAFTVHNEGLGYLTAEFDDQPDVLKVAVDSYGGGGPEGIIVYAGNTNLGTFNPAFDLSGSGPHLVRVTYTPGDLDVYFDNALVLSNLNVNVASLGASDANGSSWIGFGARTGGEAEFHNVNYWSFVVPEPSSLSLCAIAVTSAVTTGRRRRRS